MAEYFNIISPRYIELVKKPLISPKFKVELLDYSEKNVLYEIVEDIDSSSGSISINYQQGVRASCSFTVNNQELKYSPSYHTGMFWINSKFKLYIGIYDESNGDIYWFSQGVYYPTNPTNNHNFSNKTVQISGVDKFGMLGGELNYHQLTGTYQFKAGQKIYNIVKDILMLEMGNGYVIDPVEPLLDPLYKDEVLPYDLNKATGSYLSDILIEIGNILGSNIYYNKNGRLVISAGTIDMSYSQRASIWDYSDKELEYMNSSVFYDYSQVINSLTVVGNNVNDKIYSWKAENNNPLSPTRIEYIGRKEIAPIETSMAYSEQRAKEYAEFQLNRLSILQTSMDFSSTLLPHLDVDQVCTITDEYFNYKMQRFIIQSLQIPFNTKGEMQISASNIAGLPYYDLLVGG